MRHDGDEFAGRSRKHGRLDGRAQSSLIDLVDLRAHAGLRSIGGAETLSAAMPFELIPNPGSLQ